MYNIYIFNFTPKSQLLDVTFSTGKNLLKKTFKEMVVGINRIWPNIGIKSIAYMQSIQRYRQLVTNTNLPTNRKERDFENVEGLQNPNSSDNVHLR